jgi:hypothetical protein
MGKKSIIEELNRIKQLMGLIKEVNNDMYDNIGRNDRIIMTKDENIEFKPIPIEIQNKRTKPIGLWYAIGTEWIDWVRNEMPDFEEKNVFKIDINERKIRLIKTYNEIKEFDLEYGVDINNMYNMREIDWKRVANDYGGIEIFYVPKARHSFSWYYGWDISSGCIWDNGVITNITKIE